MGSGASQLMFGLQLVSLVHHEDGALSPEKLAATPAEDRT
jgi:hypothetical protein